MEFSSGVSRWAEEHSREEYVEIDSLLPGLKFVPDIILRHF